MSAMTISPAPARMPAATQSGISLPNAQDVIRMRFPRQAACLHDRHIATIAETMRLYWNSRMAEMIGW
jgi:hypothetical protein